MPAGKEQGKHDNYKKPSHKGFRTASWEDRLADNGKEDEGNITDPELIAEKEYALEHGTEFDMNLMGGEDFAVAAGDVAESKSADKAKIKQAKADRKARGRGVSGSMCKKDKDIACGGFHTLMDMDVYYGLDDEYDTYASGTEETINCYEDSYEYDSPQEKRKSEDDLMNEEMNQMCVNDDDEEEDDDRPGPSRSYYYGTNNDAKPKRY